MSCSLAYDFAPNIAGVAAVAVDSPAAAGFPDAADLDPAVDKVHPIPGDTRRQQAPLFVAVEA